LKKVIVEFPARQWKLHMTGSSIQLTNNLNCSQDGQPDHSFLEWKCFPLIL